MATHRFSVGDVVCLQSRSRMTKTIPDSFEITALLPLRDGVLQYRMKSELERHERVVPEDEIELASGSAANSNIPAHLRDGV